MGPELIRVAVSLVVVNLLKLLMNLSARSVAATRHLEGESHTFPGSRIFSSTPLILVGMLKLKTGRVANSQFEIDPSSIALTISLVEGRSILEPVPYGPCFCIVHFHLPGKFVGIDDWIEHQESSSETC